MKGSTTDDGTRVVLLGLRADSVHAREEAMTERLAAPLSVSEQLALAEERGRRMERVKCAEIAGLYPLEGFCWDTNNHGEILRLRDTISEAILKSVPVGEMIK